jgi:hypothetical protein
VSGISYSPDNIKVWKLFKYCKESFGKAGINISFPKNTDPRKTYKWRYLENFSNKIDNWNVSDDTITQLIDSMVAQAKKRGHINKGLALLTSDQILEDSLKIIENSDELDRLTVNRIKQECALILDLNLLAKNKHHGLPLIIRLYIQNKISDVLLALSQKCHNAMIQLDNIERAMLPNGKKLIMLRMNVNKNPRIRNELKNILQSDWRNI